MDSLSFDDVYKQYHRLVEQQLKRSVLSASPEDQEELAQDIWLKVSQALPSFKGDSEITTWLYAIVNHTATDYLRRPNGLDTVAYDAWDAGIEDTTQVDEDGNPEASLIRGEAIEQVGVAISALPARQWKALRLTVEGWTYEEIAAELGCTTDAVNKLLYRARRSLNEQGLSVESLLS